MDSQLLDTDQSTITVPASILDNTSAETTTTFAQLFTTDGQADTIVRATLKLIGRQQRLASLVGQGTSADLKTTIANFTATNSISPANLARIGDPAQAVQGTTYNARFAVGN